MHEEIERKISDRLNEIRLSLNTIIKRMDMLEIRLNKYEKRLEEIGNEFADMKAGR